MGFEIKWDGIRAIAYIDDGLRMTSRPTFQRLQGRMNVSPAHLTTQLRAEVPVVYVVFDLLYLDGRTLMTTSYEDRRAELDRVLEAGPRWHAPAYLRGHGAELLEASRQQQLEGVVAKRLASRYHPGTRGQDWLKIKNIRRQELVIGGWLPGEGAFTGFLGALTVGYYDQGGVFRYAGRVGTGMTLQHRRQLKAMLAPLAVAESPFVGAQPDKPGAIFVRPELVCEVAFTQWTAIGTLRQPAYKGLRPDKAATDVIREGPQLLRADPHRADLRVRSGRVAATTGAAWVERFSYFVVPVLRLPVPTEMDSPDCMTRHRARLRRYGRQMFPTHSHGHRR